MPIPKRTRKTIIKTTEEDIDLDDFGEAIEQYIRHPRKTRTRAS